MVSQEVVLFNILPRVPAESTTRFMCVSKAWHSFLTTRLFARMHLFHHQNQHKLLYKSNTTFSTVDCEAPEHGLTTPLRFPFNLDIPDQTVSIITSFEGLVCVGVKDKRIKNEYTSFILWNPLTGDYKTLSKAYACKECYETNTRASTLYYISSEDDYKLLRKDRAERGHPSCIRLVSRHSVSLDETLYFLKEDKADEYSVVRLDLKTGSFTEAATPFLRDLTTVTILRGYIHVWMRADSRFELWKMDANHSDWTKAATYWPPSLDQEPFPLMADGHWLMLKEGCLLKHIQ
ncbi:F-box protein ETP1-like [Bidens hawaiensis]|uniref:F-box protein ETP1-like n=1 Tax=Bidens hawaiensis TaxID=980011 RepID=UPI00404A5FE2